MSNELKIDVPAFTREQAMRIALDQELRGQDRAEPVSTAEVAHITIRGDGAIGRGPLAIAERIGHTEPGPYTPDQLDRLYNLLAVAEAEATRLRAGNRALLDQLAAAQKWYRSEWHVDDGHDAVYPWDPT